MYQILKDFFSKNRSHTIAFKGGTLAYFLYELDRFSTDLDIDCLQGLPTIKQIEDIQTILEKYTQIKDFQRFQNMHRYIVSYGENDHNIKVEFNSRIRKTNTYETVNFFGTAIQAMDKGSIFANKLVAVIDRNKPTSRDIRDIHFFFEHHFPINDAIIQERMHINIKEFFTKLKKYIQDTFVSSKIVDANLGVVLTDQQKIWAKKSLIENTINYIDLVLFELQ